MKENRPVPAQAPEVEDLNDIFLESSPSQETISGSDDTIQHLSSPELATDPAASRKSASTAIIFAPESAINASTKPCGSA